MGNPEAFVARLYKLDHSHSFGLRDSDLWGLECALTHCIQDGYFKDEQNLEWAQAMLEYIRVLRQEVADEE